MNETEMIKVFIQHQAFQLFKWLFGNLTIDFDPFWLPFALSEDSIDIALFLYYSKKKEVDAVRDVLYRPIILAFENSSKFLIFKIFFLKEFFTASTANEAMYFLKTLKKRIFDPSQPEENPFLSIQNPVKLGLNVIELLRMISAKYASTIVLCKELEAFITNAIIDFVEKVDNERDVRGYMTEADNYGRDCYRLIEVLEIFDFYRVKVI